MEDRFEIKLHEARSPSDLLWLNRDVSKRTARCSGIVIGIIVTMLIVVSGFIFSDMLAIQIYIDSRQDPLAMSCESINLMMQDEDSLM